MDLPRIELGSRQCECRVVPLDHRPFVSLSGCRESVTNNFLAVAQKFSRPRLAISPCLARLAPAFDPLAPRAYARSSIVHLSLSGCRESNPDLTLPKRVYYHYTTPRTMLAPRTMRLASAKRWTIPESNRLPFPCHGNALPSELMARRRTNLSYV